MCSRAPIGNALAVFRRDSQRTATGLARVAVGDHRVGRRELGCSTKRYEDGTPAGSATIGPACLSGRCRAVAQ
jgi:hypothetical protein